MTLKVGELELAVVSDGQFRLDGGAMFGIIPKVMWEKNSPADDRNRIQLGLNCLLIRSASELMLIDTGIGDLYDDKFASRYAVDKSDCDLLRGLAALGVQPEQVDKVVLTHLHFDHCGGNCRVQEDGSVAPTFPNATYFINEGELVHAKNPDPRSRGSYLPHTWESLERSGQLATTSANETISSGVELLTTPGHTEHHQSVLIRSAAQTVCFLADVAPTMSHLRISYVMGFDLYPVKSMASKSMILEMALAEDWLLVFEHSPDAAAGHLNSDQEIDRIVSL